MRLVTDQNGNIRNRYNYDAFGTILDSSVLEPNVHLYAGEQYDPDLNVYYLRARVMNPSTGRFLTADTFDGMQTDPRSLHKYLYASADPVNRIDPSGNESLIGVMVRLASGIASRGCITA